MTVGAFCCCMDLWHYSDLGQRMGKRGRKNQVERERGSGRDHIIHLLGRKCDTCTHTQNREIKMLSRPFQPLTHMLTI